ncbi:hypothetical protein EJ02DRAFT_64915 [Clathrospora elynae]|uniref:Uncharacterized protein n=1 Tax=Clathrospora elynae TaxID=706981 RepID=A0A6A5SYN0_9PLEO|nr:hypothetical protein EJ02DRAFT_64915 [Clathrospora elynae]
MWVALQPHLCCAAFGVLRSLRRGGRCADVHGTRTHSTASFSNLRPLSITVQRREANRQTPRFEPANFEASGTLFGVLMSKATRSPASNQSVGKHHD